MVDLTKIVSEFVKARCKTIEYGDNLAEKLQQIVRAIIPDANVFLDTVIFEFHVTSMSRLHDIDKEEREVPIEIVLHKIVPDYEFYFQSHILLTKEEAKKLKTLLKIKRG